LKYRLLDLGSKPVILKKKRRERIKFLWELLLTIFKAKVHIIHCRNALSTIIYGGIAAKILRKPFIVSFHGYNPFRYGNNTFIFNNILHSADKIITVSYDLKKYLANFMSIPLNKIAVIHNGIKVVNITPRMREQKRKELGFCNRKPIVGCVGNLREVKGHRYLILASKIILNKFPEAIFILAGDGELKGELEELTEREGIKEKFLFLGKRNDILELMSIFDIFVLPSLSEGLCNALLEAMATELPVVATNAGGNPEVVVDGVTGFLVPPKNPYKMAEAIVKILQNPELAKQMGKAGRKRVEEKFSLERMVREYERVYRSIVHGQRSTVDGS